VSKDFHASVPYREKERKRREKEKGKEKRCKTAIPKPKSNPQSPLILRIYYERREKRGGEKERRRVLDQWILWPRAFQSWPSTLKAEKERRGGEEKR